MIPLEDLLIYSGLLFAVGVFGVLTRRNFILLLVSIEIIMNAAILNFIAFAAYSPSTTSLGGVTGQGIAVILIGLAATEVAVGLAIVVALNRIIGSVNVSKAMELKL
jgi:NADH:ubiquinone oxidoreductase subunit K